MTMHLGCVPPGSQAHDLESWQLWIRRTVAVACTRLALLVTMHLALCSSLVGRPMISVNRDRYAQCNLCSCSLRGDGTGVVLGQFIDPLCATTGALVQVQSWTRCSCPLFCQTGALLVQTVQITVELPQLQFRRLCWRRCIMQRQVQLFSRREQWKGLRFRPHHTTSPPPHTTTTQHTNTTHQHNTPTHTEYTQQHNTTHTHTNTPPPPPHHHHTTTSVAILAQAILAQANCFIAGWQGPLCADTECWPRCLLARRAT